MDKIIKDKHYFNSIYKVNGGILKIERMYRVNENLFKDSTYDELAKIYRMLPEFLYNPSEVISWYGDFAKGDKYYLYVLFEESGLKFVGNLPEKDFLEWEEEFHKHIVKIPFKK